MHLTGLDIFVIAAFFAVNLGIGVYYARRTKNVGDFFVSGGKAPWWLTGTLYGFALYLVMNALVLPLRFGAPFPPADLAKGAVALFPHIVFIGLPLAWLTRKAA